MLKIGEFSKIAQVSIKTLRFYDQVGLLKPAHIDRYNGYRYYDLSQLVQMNRILAFKDLDFSLEQIRELLKANPSENALRQMLNKKARELRQRIDDEQARLVRVETRIWNINGVMNPDLSPIVLKSAPNQQIASVRQVLPTANALRKWKKEQLQRIKHYLKDLDIASDGPEIMIYHQDEFRDIDIDVEVGTIILGALRIKGVGSEKDLIRLRMLAGANQVASLIIMGESSLLTASYASLTQWTQLNGFRPIGPWRELAYDHEHPDSSAVIEIQRPVIKATDYFQELEKNEMEPTIKTKPAFILVGLRYYGKNEHQEISELWSELNQRISALGGLKYETGEAAIGLCTVNNEETNDGSFEYVAGFPVTKAEDMPQGFVVRHVPEYTYAIFAHKGDLKSLGKTYEYIYESWLPQSGFQLADKIDFEYYDKDFKDFAPDSVFYIYLPIKK
jgi:predicted transcriptional regulator YdeE/DNA-binding transcriptional MerR regulator